MTALLLIWLGGMVPVAAVAVADATRNGDTPAWVHLIAIALWPIFLADLLCDLVGGGPRR